MTNDRIARLRGHIARAWMMTRRLDPEAAERRAAMVVAEQVPRVARRAIDDLYAHMRLSGMSEREMRRVAGWSEDLG